IDFGDWDPPQIFFGGASGAAEEVAAEHVDTNLAWGETPAQIAQRLDRLRARAAAHGRTLQFGIRLHVISRDTSADAWAHAERLLSSISEER
ncbi:alkanesulfonate monooxygenase, partial [Enterococcus faecium]